jgi:hypothetical protein
MSTLSTFRDAAQTNCSMGITVYPVRVLILSTKAKAQANDKK